MGLERDLSQLVVSELDLGCATDNFQRVGGKRVNFPEPTRLPRFLVRTETLEARSSGFNHEFGIQGINSPLEEATEQLIQLLSLVHLEMGDRPFNGARIKRIVAPSVGIIAQSDATFGYFSKYFEEAKSKVLGKKQEKKHSFFESLLGWGIADLPALILASHFENLLVCMPAALSSKNLVYHVTDLFGRERVVKIYKDKAGADIESMINFAFSKHPRLKSCVAGTEELEPTKITVGEKDFYLTNQCDITSKIDPEVQFWLRRGSKHELFRYIDFWMERIADLHYFGTKIAKDLNVTKMAGSLFHERGRERIELAKISVDRKSYGAAIDVLSQCSHYNGTLIHRDLGPNVKGQFALDWDHAGWGHAIVDLVSFLQEAALQRHGQLAPDELKHFLGSYLQRIRTLEKNYAPVENREINLAYEAFRLVSQPYCAFQAAYLELKPDRSLGEELNLALLKSRINELGMKKSVDTLSTRYPVERVGEMEFLLAVYYHD